MDFKKIIFAVIILGVAGIIGFVWWRQYQAGTIESRPVVVSDNTGRDATTVENVSAEAAEIIRAIETLKSINLDTEFFRDERFLELIDTSVPISPPSDPQVRRLDLFTPSNEGGN